MVLTLFALLACSKFGLVEYSVGAVVVVLVERVWPSVNAEDAVGAELVALDFSVDSVNPLGRDKDRSCSATATGIGTDDVPYCGTGDAASICCLELSTIGIGWSVGC